MAASPRLQYFDFCLRSSFLSISLYLVISLLLLFFVILVFLLYFTGIVVQNFLYRLCAVIQHTTCIAKIAPDISASTADATVHVSFFTSKLASIVSCV